MQQEAWEGYLIRVGEENSEGAGKSWELLGKKADEASHALKVGPKKASSVMEVTKQLRWEEKGRGRAAENWKNLVSGQACLEFGLGSEEEPERGKGVKLYRLTRELYELLSSGRDTCRIRTFSH